MGAACCCVSLLEPPTAKPSVCVVRACLIWAIQSIAATSMLKYPSHCPRILTANSAAFSKPSPVLSATQVRKQRRVPEEAMDNNQYTRIVIGESRSASYYSEQEMAESCQVDVQMIRRLQVVGLIEGITLAGGEQRYSGETLPLVAAISQAQPASSSLDALLQRSAPSDQ